MIRFDPRTKLVAVATASALSLLSASFFFELTLMAGSLALVAMGGRPRLAAKAGAAFAMLAATEWLVVPAFGGFAGGLVMFVAVLVRKILPCVALGAWLLATTEVSVFLAAMRRIRIPESVLVPASVAFRYFPTLAEQGRDVRNAMRMRGIGLSVEHVLVPIMLSAVTASDELSAAALCRGIDRPGARTSLAQVGLRAPDVAVMTVCALGAAGALAMRATGAL